MADPDKARLIELAANLCNDMDARVIARQVKAPLFADSAKHVQDYWLAIALRARAVQP